MNDSKIGLMNNYSDFIRTFGIASRMENINFKMDDEISSKEEVIVSFKLENEKSQEIEASIVISAEKHLDVYVETHHKLSKIVYMPKFARFMFKMHSKFENDCSDYAIDKYTEYVFPSPKTGFIIHFEIGDNRQGAYTDLGAFVINEVRALIGAFEIMLDEEDCDKALDFFIRTRTIE